MPFVYGLFFLNSTIPSTALVSNETFPALQQMINALHVMISMLMSPHNHDVDLIDAHIKVFLSCCNRYERVITGNSLSAGIPHWAKKGNFVSLLNLREQIEFFGSVRLYWEGSRERFIQVVKAILVSMQRSVSYFVEKMTLIQKLNLFEWIKQDFRDSLSVERDIKCFHQYDSVQDVEKLFADGMPVSAFTLKCGEKQEIYVRVGKRNEYKMRPIRFHSTSQSPNMCGLHYLNCELLSNDELETTKADFLYQVELYCVLLPYIKKHQTFSCQYAIVFDDWDTIDSHCKKSIPTIYDKLFQIDVMRLLL